MMHRFYDFLGNLIFGVAILTITMLVLTCSLITIIGCFQMITTTIRG